MNIGQILKSKARGVETGRADDSIEHIASRLAERNIGVIIITSENGSVTGVISERDIIRLIAKNGAKALALKASDGMTREVVTCTRANTLDEIMEMMAAGRFRHLPVVEDGALVGIVSTSDIVKHHIAEVELEVTAMRGYLATG